MSSSSARAKQRRANIQPPVQEAPPTQQTATRGGMTLPQVLQLVDSRITNLEKIAKDNMDAKPPLPPKVEIDESWKEIMKEYDARFTILATEINELKDTVVKLQTYTMDVNKTLLEERIHLMVDMSDVKEKIIMTESGTEPMQINTEEVDESEEVADSEESEERNVISDNE